MKIFNSSEYKVYKTLIGLTQNQLHEALFSFLQKHYLKVVNTKEYLYAVGDIPIALAAHMDTVFKHPAERLYYDQRKNTMWSPDGMGADDRAGVFAIMRIIKSGLRPSIIFTTDEEIGGLGAYALSKEKCPFPDLKYIIQLDRRGKDDCVFYELDNPQFQTYVESFGFKTQEGIFSDISILCPEWSICGVNLSVGYEDEHSIAETLNVGYLLDTIDKVKKMLKDANNAEKLEYIERKRGYDFYKFNYDNQIGLGELEKCKHCHRDYPDYELFPITDGEGNVGMYCPECLVDYVNWCKKCGNPFEVEKGEHRKYCPECEAKERELAANKTTAQ